MRLACSTGDHRAATERERERLSGSLAPTLAPRAARPLGISSIAAYSLPVSAGQEDSP